MDFVITRGRERQLLVAIIASMFLLNFYQVDLGFTNVFLLNILVLLVSLIYSKQIVEMSLKYPWYLLLYLSIFFVTLHSYVFITNTTVQFQSLILPFSMIISSLLLLSLFERGSIKDKEVILLLYRLGLVVSFFSIIQYVLFNFLGIKLGLSDIQDGQIAVNRMPGFSYESDVNGKSLGFFLVMLMPFYLRKPNELKFFPIILVAFILVQTRTAFIGFALAVVALYLIYMLDMTSRNKATTHVNVFLRMIKLLLLLLFIVTMFAYIFVLVGDNYIIERFLNMLNMSHTVSSDVSYLYRMTDINFTIENILSENFGWIFGEGWGSKLYSSISHMGVDIDEPAGSLILFILFYGGLFLSAVFFYYPFMLTIRCLYKYLKSSHVICLSLALGMIYIISVSIVGSMWNKYVFWFLFALTSYFSKNSKSIVFN